MKADNVFYSNWLTVREPLKENLLISIDKDLYFPLSEDDFTLNISADDYYKLYINGQLVGQGPAPSYSFSYCYNSYNITGFIRQGELNRICIKVYYQGLVNRVWVSGDGKQGFIADIFSGNKLLYSADESWTYKTDTSFLKGSILGYDTAFSELCDFTAEEGKSISLLGIPHPHTFRKEPVPSLQLYTVAPVIAEYSSNRLFLDFGKERVGYLNLTVNSSRNKSNLTVHLAEELSSDGSVRYDMRCNCRYEDKYILKKGENIISPFDYKAFRYCELVFDDGVEITDAHMLVRHFPFPENNISLKTDDEKLIAIFILCCDTVKYGTQELFVDCPTREKGQYFGDVTVSGFSQLYLTDDSYLIKKAFSDFASSYSFCGEFLAVSPCSYKQKIADYTLQFAFNLYRYYQYTKDRTFVAEMLPFCNEINNYFSKFKRADGLLEKVDEQWNLVDWPENARDGYDFDLSDPIGDGCHNVINAFYISSILYTEKIKDIMGIKHENEYSKLIRAFNNAFFDESTRLYKDSEFSSHSSLHGNCLPALFGICDEDNTAITDFLLNKRLSCGVYMAYFYLKSLCLLGKKNEVLEIITCDDENSWNNMLSQGATTCFEAWGKDKKWNTSLFHPWATAPVCILKEEFPDIF